MRDQDRHLPSSLRQRWRQLTAGTRIVLLVAIAVLPLLGLHLLHLTQIASAQRLHIEHDTQDLADAVSLAVEGALNLARSVALALAETPAFQAQDAPVATATLRATLAQNPEFVNFWAATAGGEVYASALPAPIEPPSIAGEPYFVQLLETGEPVLQAVDGIPQAPDVFAAVVAVPVRPNAEIDGSLQVAMRFIGLEQLAVHIGLPAESVVTVVDGQGVVVARSLEPERWEGVSIVDTEVWQAVEDIDEGTVEVAGPDGVLRLHGIQTVPGTDWKAIVGLPSPKVWAVVDATIRQQSLTLALTAILAGLVAWRGKLLADQVDVERRRLQGVVNQLPEGVLLTAPDGRVRVANRVLEELLQTTIQPGQPHHQEVDLGTRWAREEPQRREYLDAQWAREEPQRREYLGAQWAREEPQRREYLGAQWLEGDRPLLFEELPFERARRGEAVQGVQLAVARADGSRRDLLVNALPLRDAEGRIEEVLAVVADITPLKDLDRAKDEFISIAAHELRNPLAGLKGYAQILLRQARQKGYDEETVRILAAIDQQVDRLTELISRLLDVSRLQLGRLQLVRQPTDVVALAREVQEALQLTTSRHQITVDATPEKIVGDWDPGLLRQVFNNLVGNAIRYTPGGRVAIRLGLEDAQADVLVSDEGPGIAPERLPYIFERFRQVLPRPERQAGGLGLGLYLSKGIVEAHGGRIGVESQAGRGSTFWFTLPLHAGGAAREPAPELLQVARVW
jgi:signal transduction histidine kinase